MSLISTSIQKARVGDGVDAGFKMWHRHHLLCAWSHLDLIKNQRFGSRTSWHRTCSSQTETKLAVCRLLWHFQGQCTQFTIFVNKTTMAAFLLCGGCIPRLLLSLCSFASHQSVSWEKDLISAVGVAPENVLCCSHLWRLRQLNEKTHAKLHPVAARRHQTSPSSHF